jgi:hypothetical protein
MNAERRNLKPERRSGDAPPLRSALQPCRAKRDASYSKFDVQVSAFGVHAVSAFDVRLFL